MTLSAEERALVNRSKHGAPFDVVLHGGEVLDTSTGLRGPRDVAFAWGRVAAVEPAGSIAQSDARVSVDASGKLVTAGLIDLHTHVYVGGSELVVPADEIGPPSGCTTVVDAGTAGGNTMLGFKLLTEARVRTRTFAFVHISSFGLAGHPHGESRDLVYLDPEIAARAVLGYPGFVLGVKVRQTERIVGNSGMEPLKRAVAAAELSQRLIQEEEQRLGIASGGRKVPVMVHVGSAPAPFDEVMSLLRPGDVVTHCFNGGSRDLRREDGTFEEAARVAQQRGIHFDVGHGAGSFSYKVAKTAAEAGFWPNTISTDLHSLSVTGRAVDMPTTMSKFLDLGMSLEDVVERSTVAPARFIEGALPPRDREPLRGTLQVGAPGDAAVFERIEGESPFMDSTGYQWSGKQRLEALHTVLKGRLWGRPYPHPYLIP